MGYGGNFATKTNKGFSSSVTNWVRGGGVAGEGSDPYSDQFRMYPGGKGAPTAGPQNLFRTNIGRGVIDFYGPGSGAQFKKDTTMKGWGGSNILLGYPTGNVAYRQRIFQDKSGVVRRTSPTDAILYEIQSIPGRLGFVSPHTERYRTKYQSMGWAFQLKQSMGPNKAPYGIAQSSVDTTLERYATIETKYLSPGIYDTDERWDPETEKWERKWKGWKELKVKDQWRHYTPLSARMFKKVEGNEGKGRSRRFIRAIL